MDGKFDTSKIRALIESAGIIDMEGAAKILGISYQRVKVLRADGNGNSPDRFPESLNIPGGPVYLTAEITQWGRQTGRLDVDGLPVKLRTTGRPRKRDRAGKFLATS